MISISTWQDDVKATGRRINPMGSWHYADGPYVPDPTAAVNLPPPTYNVTNCINESFKTLLDETTTSSWSLSFALRNLIHFVGDVHCPMHAVALFNNDFPDGDQGGNYIKLSTAVFGANGGNLHKVWDSGGFTYQVALPKAALDANITRIITKHTKESMKDRLANMNAFEWIKEAWSVASTYAYDGVVINETLPESYLVNARAKSEELLAIAGYRLGALLTEFFEVRGLPDLEKASWVEAQSIAGPVISWVLVLVAFAALIATKIITYRKYQYIDVLNELN